MSTVDRYRDPKLQAAADALAKQAGVSEADRLRLAQTIVTRPEPDWLKTLLTKQTCGCTSIIAPAGCIGWPTSPSRTSWGRRWTPSAGLKAEPKNDSTQLGGAVRRCWPSTTPRRWPPSWCCTDGVTTEARGAGPRRRRRQRPGRAALLRRPRRRQRRRNLRLHDLQAVDSVYVNDRIIFELKLHGVGYPGQTVPVTLKEKGKDEVLDKQDGDAQLGRRGGEGQACSTSRPTPGERTFIIETPLTARRGRQGGQPRRAESSSARRSSSRCCTSRATGVTSITSSRRCSSARATGPRATRASTSRWCC